MASNKKSKVATPLKDVEEPKGYLTHDEDDDWMAKRISDMASVNSVIDSEYGWCGDSISYLLKAILRELVIARLTR